MRVSLVRRALLALAPVLPSLPLQQAVASRPISDPRFSLLLPDGYAVSKRSTKQGTLFVAGDFPRAAVVSVSAWPLSELIEEEARGRSLPGMAADSASVPAGVTSLDDVKAILGGSADGLARVLLRRRDVESSSGSLASILLKTELTDQRLQWDSSTQLSVADPEELYKQRGIRVLVRRSSAVSVLGRVPAGSSGAGTVPAVFSCCASALETDWSELGPALETTVKSFELT